MLTWHAVPPTPRETAALIHRCASSVEFSGYRVLPAARERWLHHTTISFDTTGQRTPRNSFCCCIAKPEFELGGRAMRVGPVGRPRLRGCQRPTSGQQSRVGNACVGRAVGNRHKLLSQQPLRWLNPHELSNCCAAAIVSEGPTAADFAKIVPMSLCKIATRQNEPKIVCAILCPNLFR